MAHEQSETYSDEKGKARNVYGKRTARAGQVLPPKYGFERLEYRSVDDAVIAAKLRSMFEGGLRPLEESLAPYASSPGR